MKATKAEFVKFHSSDGLELHGVLFRPGRNRSVIINVFGLTGDFFSWRFYDHLIPALKRSDFFLANNRGMSFLARFEKKGRKNSVTIGGAKERFEDCIKDIRGAIDAMLALGYKDIILMGHSTGCQKITYYQYKTRDSRVKALVLLGPVDDYNLTRKQLGRNFGKAVRAAKRMAASGKGGDITPEWISKLTAKRFLSYADLENVEARLFNYDGGMKEFSSIGVPVLAVFGSAEQHVSSKSVKQCLEILRNRTDSEHFTSVVVKGANHGFDGRERELSLAVVKWLSRLKP